MNAMQTDAVLDAAASPPRSANQPDMPLSLLARVCAWATVAVVLLGVAREFLVAAIGTQTALQDVRHFALDSEQNLGAWYSSCLMLICAGLLFLTARAQRGGTGARSPRYWYILALLFLAFSLDESVSFHEVLIAPLRDMLGTGGVLYFAWVIPGALFVAVVGLYFLPFLSALPRRTAVLFVLAGALFIGGALGLELVGGYLVDSEGWDSKRYIAVAVLEETMELAGLTLFVHALVAHLRAHAAHWRLG